MVFLKESEKMKKQKENGTNKNKKGIKATIIKIVHISKLFGNCLCFERCSYFETCSEIDHVCVSIFLSIKVLKLL